jgi:chemotaxis protein CheZ
MSAETMQMQVSSVEGVPMASDQEDMLHRIGHVTRELHNNLVGLGLDKILDQVAHDIPDARDRLNYVAKMTEQAAERVLNCTDIASPLQEEISKGAAKLENDWKVILDSHGLKSEYNAKVQETLEFLQLTSANTAQTKALLMDIMMAQDFQDLTGQVIKKITGLAQDLEKQLVQVLIDFSPQTKKEKQPDNNSSLLNGPQINPQAENVVASQEQVDDLLDSLGF